MSLRPYQIAAREGVRSRYLRGERAALVVLPTGTGKTRTALSMAADTIRRGRRVLWLAHRSELIDQPVDNWRGLPEFADVGTCGAVQSGRNEVDARLVCASVQTLARGDRLDQVLAHGLPALVVVDEAHHSAAGQWRTVLDRLDVAAEAKGERRPWWLGLTATPERTDRADLSGLWGQEPAYVYTYQEAIADGYLCPPRFVVDRLALDEETKRLLAAASERDDEAEMARLMLRAGVVEHTARAMGEHAAGRRALVFTADVTQAVETRAALMAAGMRAAVVSGETPDGQRRAILRAFARGELEAICNCAVLTEGTDLPSCDAVVMARPFSSKPLYVQAVGRGLRLYPGKDACLVLDLTGASEEHSLIMAAALLPPPENMGDSREPFIGTLRKRAGTLVPPLRVKCEPIAQAEEVASDINGRGWRVVAIRVSEAWVPVEPVEVHVPRQVERDPSDRVQVPDMWRERAPVLAEWAMVEPGVWSVGAGDHGLVMLVELGEDGWMSYLFRKGARKPQPMGRRPCPEEVARSLGDDLFRQAQGLVRRDASWKRGPPSPKAEEYAAGMGIDTSAMTAGDLALAIAAHKGRERLRKVGIAGFRAVLDVR